MKQKRLFVGRFIFEGKVYKCRVKDGVASIEGKSVEEFMLGLTDIQKLKFAALGKQKMDDLKVGQERQKGFYQKKLETFN